MKNKQSPLIRRTSVTKSCCLMMLLLVSCASAQSPVPVDATLERIATGFQFVEGPLWKDGIGLLFSDIPGNTVYRWTPETGATVFLTPSANSNGLTLDREGRLVLAQTGLRRVARLEANNAQTSLAATYTGKKLNSPNDLVVKSDGAIFFTDPPFNIPPNERAELTFSGIYRISPSGTLQLLDSSLNLPNGICFSPDEKRLYVNNSAERVIYVWDVTNDSLIANKRRFASMAPAGNADGMKVDSAGNLFCTGPLGVWVFAPDGTVLDTILVPGQTSNCNWGDADRKSLYITAGNSVYRIRLAATTGVEEHGSLPPETFELYANYPNPFNPSTAIQYRLPDPTQVRLSIYDISGKEVETLVDEYQNSGIHRYTWNASIVRGRHIASGTYLASIRAGKSSKAIKLILVN